MSFMKSGTQSTNELQTSTESSASDSEYPGSIRGGFGGNQNDMLSNRGDANGQGDAFFAGSNNGIPERFLITEVIRNIIILNNKLT
jgi:hypothetical protein